MKKKKKGGGGKLEMKGGCVWGGGGCLDINIYFFFIPFISFFRTPTKKNIYIKKKK